MIEYPIPTGTKNDFLYEYIEDQSYDPGTFIQYLEDRLGGSISFYDGDYLLNFKTEKELTLFLLKHEI